MNERCDPDVAGDPEYPDYDGHGGDRHARVGCKGVAVMWWAFDDGTCRVDAWVGYDRVAHLDNVPLAEREAEVDRLWRELFLPLSLEVL